VSLVTLILWCLSIRRSNIQAYARQGWGINPDKTIPDRWAATNLIFWHRA